MSTDRWESRRHFQNVQEVKSIFVTILRLYLPLSLDICPGGAKPGKQKGIRSPRGSHWAGDAQCAQGEPGTAYARKWERAWERTSDWDTSQRLRKQLRRLPLAKSGSILASKQLSTGMYYKQWNNKNSWVCIDKRQWVDEWIEKQRDIYTYIQKRGRKEGSGLQKNAMANGEACREPRSWSMIL